MSEYDEPAPYQFGRGTGPLRGLKVIEIAGIGPGPHACTILADLGADVVRIEKAGGAGSASGRQHDICTRGRPSVVLDLKKPAAVEAVLTMVEQADVITEGMRPGAMERLGLGPDECLARNPRLVYGRMTGWGQTGPLAHTAGHDMNYIALTGLLHGLGQDPSRPHFPANLLGDFGGGSTYLVIGILAAVLEARASGQGQVVDAAIVDGTAHLGAMTVSMVAAGRQPERRASSLLDGGVPFYDLYETADGEHMTVGALEPQFYDEFVRLLGIADSVPDRGDFGRLDELRDLIAATFKTRTQAEWAEIFDGTDACVAPVLPISRAKDHPHMAAREVYVERDGVLQPAPAPRFSRTAPTLTSGPTRPGADTAEVLAAWGVARVDELLESGAALQARPG